MPEALFPFFFAAVAVFIVLIAMAESRKQKEFASSLRASGVEVTREPSMFSGKVEGRFHGRAVTIEHVKHGKNGPWTTRVRVSHAGPPGFDLRVDRMGFAAAIATRLGGQDVRVGDEDFDRRFRVRTGDEDRATFVLGPEPRQALAAMDFKRFEARDGGVLLELHGRIREAPRIVDALRFVDEAAARVEATA